MTKTLSFKSTERQEIEGVAGKALIIKFFSAPDGDVSAYQIIIHAELDRQTFRLPALQPSIGPNTIHKNYFSMSNCAYNISDGMRVFLQVFPVNNNDTHVNALIDYEIEDQHGPYPTIEYLLSAL